MAKDKVLPTTMDVQFKTFSIDDDGVRIGFAVNRSAINLQAADKLFNDTRLAVHMSCDPNSATDAEGQTRLHGDDFLKLDMTCELGGFSVRGSLFNVSMVTEKKGLDLMQLSRFANTMGKIEAERIEGDKKEK